MAYIRDKKEERTGYQIGDYPLGNVDNQCDFVMVYRLNDSTAERIEKYRKLGYVIHFMTGISWGAYKDYLYGEYDGVNHWDEAQTDRYGNIISHGVDVPYMCPSVQFADYLTEKLKPVVDAGVEAIHVEEPEFWDRAGYSEGFKREFEMYYKMPWTPPHESVDAWHKCARLKQYLFTRTLDRVGSAIKAYAKRKHGQDLLFYVPTHSLLNYTQWKIVSPEGKLADIPAVDGCIAQVWTGTSREKNWFNGEYKERTFETAYLEYGIMQELVSGTDRHMWFLHDPIEDNPIFDWNDYRKNYFCTVTASLLHPKINTYEICPWPNRVFNNKYPKDAPDAVLIPDEYATVLNNTFNTLGTIENVDDSGLRVGILTGDSQLYQRTYPDCCYSKKAEEETGTVLREGDGLIDEIKSKIMNGEGADNELILRFMSSSAFPGFYSLAMPLLKYGVPVRPVLLDNARKYAGYLDNYDVLLLSYEYLKPDYPDLNASLAQWVRAGGTLIYIGDGFDPYNEITSWWSGKYSNPAEHLFEMLELTPESEKAVCECGKGAVGIWQINPCVFCYSKENADLLRAFFDEVTAVKGKKAEYKNNLILRRNEYIIAAVMDESISDESLELKGLFADMYAPDFAICKSKTVAPGENALLLDFDKITDELCVIGTSVRVYSLERNCDEICAEIQGASDFEANIRIKAPFEIKSAAVDGKEAFCEYDAESKTALVKFPSVTGKRTLILKG